MNCRSVVGLFWLGVSLAYSSAARAADWSSLYGDAVLTREKPRLQQVAEEVAASEIGPYLTNSQKLQVGVLPISLPLATNSASPIDENRLEVGSIILPALTLLFVEDLAKAYAWLWTNHYSSETVDEYTNMLHYRKPAEFAEGRYPAPLAALHVPLNALDSPEVKKMFLRVRNSAYTFLLLRQMSRQRASGEQQADGFTLDLMKRNSEVPFGLLLLMNAGVSLPDEADPVTPRRLLAMADYLDARVQDFAQGRPDRVFARNAIHAIAKSLRASVSSMQSPAAQGQRAERARRTDVSTLLPRRQSEGGVQPLGR